MKRFFRSFYYAVCGILAAFKTELSFRLHVLALGILSSIYFSSFGIYYIRYRIYRGAL
jgi:diacylglycerol kinase